MVINKITNNTLISYLCIILIYCAFRCYASNSSDIVIPGIGVINTTYSVHNKLRNLTLTKRLGKESKLIYPDEFETSYINNKDIVNNVIRTISRVAREGSPIVFDHPNRHKPTVSLGTPLSINTLASTDKKYQLCKEKLCGCGENRLYCSRIDQDSRAELTLKSGDLPPNKQIYEFFDLDKLIIQRESFDSTITSGKIIKFKEIKELVFEEYSLFFPEKTKATENNEVEISFDNCNIANIPKNSITQRIHDMESDDDESSYRTLFVYLGFQGCVIKKMETGGIQRIRFSTLDISETQIDDMASECIHGTVYEDFLISNCMLSFVAENTIDLHVKETTLFLENHIKEIGTRSVALESFNAVILRNNVVDKMAVEALYNIKPAMTSIGSNIVFLSNTILSADSKSLIINRDYEEIYRNVAENKFNFPCECNISSIFKQLLDIEDIMDNEPIMISSLCLDGQYKSILNFMDDECRSFPILIVALGSVGVLLLITIIIVGLVCHYRVKRLTENGCQYSDCTSQSFSTLRSNALPMSPSPFDRTFNNSWAGNNQQWIMAVPEIKTYQETEVNFMLENAEPMTPPIIGLPQHFHPPLSEFKRRSQTRISCPP